MDKVKKNKLSYIIFRAFTYDLLFYYTLEMMFLTLIKGFDFSQVFIISSIDLVLIALLAIPFNYILKKVSIINRLRLGTISFIIYVLSFALINNFIALCFLVSFKSIGNFLLSINSNSLLSIICKDDESGEISKIEGRASAVWWILEAVSSVVSGYFFVFNPYISYYICASLLLISFVATFFFKIPKSQTVLETKEKVQSDVTSDTNLISKKSSVIFGLIICLFAFTFWGSAEVFGSSSKAFLQEIGTTSVVMGYIYAGVKLLTATINTVSYKIEAKLKNKFLPIAIISFFIAVIAMVILYFLNIGFIASLIILIIILLIQYLTRNPYRLNIKNTMAQFYQGQSLEKLYSFYFIAENIGGALFALLSSLIVSKLNLGYSMLINLILILLIILPTLLFYILNLRKLQNKNKEKK
jgi:MFS family permease